MNPQVRTICGTVPGTSRNNDLENRETNGARSQSDPYPKVEFSTPETSSSVDSDPEETSHMVTRVQERIPYSSPGTSSGKQKKVRSTSRPQLFRSENTSATIEADQILLALQQLAGNSNSANLSNNINNNINRISKLHKSFKTTMPNFDVKSENFELFSGLIQTSLKNYNQLTKNDKISCFLLKKAFKVDKKLPSGNAVLTQQLQILLKPRTCSSRSDTITHRESCITVEVF